MVRVISRLVSLPHHQPYSPGLDIHKFGIRSACPHPNCGLADKHGVNTTYTITEITFLCPLHGTYSLSLHNPDDIAKLEFNPPLRGLLRAELYNSDDDVSWIQVTGADYAGFYQEELLWKHVRNRLKLRIVYAPMIVDWAGSKISKSLYVRKGAYRCLRESGREYLINFAVFRSEGRDLDAVFREVLRWIDIPEEFFRCYSLEYLHRAISPAGETGLSVTSDDMR
jgi:hypothetical protein